jgi:hypothetical protein
MERVWERMKTTATRLAKRKIPVGEAESRETVLSICRQEKATLPPPEALDYLSAELLRLTLQGRRN